MDTSTQHRAQCRQTTRRMEMIVNNVTFTTHTHTTLINRAIYLSVAAAAAVANPLGSCI